MSRASTTISILLRVLPPVIMLALGIGVMYLLMQKQPEKKVAATAASIPEAVVVPVVEHTGVVDIAVDGVVVPYREIEIASEVAGRVTKKDERCRAGNYVEANHPLVVIDPTDYELEIKRLKEVYRQAVIDTEQVEQEGVNLDEMMTLATSDQTLRNREVRRLEGLRRDNAVSESDLDMSKQNLLLAETQLQTHKNAKRLLATKRSRLEAAKEIAAAHLEKAQLDLKRCTVTAPAGGVIVNAMVEQGDYVQRGISLLKLEDTSRVEVKCSLQMDDMYWLWNQPQGRSPGLPDSPTTSYQIPETDVTVAYQVAGHEEYEYRWSGILQRFDGIGLDESTRTIPCRVVVADPRGVTVLKHGQESIGASRTGPRALVRGMFVTIKIHVHPQARIVRVPQRALQPGNKLGLVRDGHYRELRDVKIVSPWIERTEGETKEYWLVEADAATILSTDQIVTKSLLGVTDGTVVTTKGATKVDTAETTTTDTAAQAPVADAKGKAVANAEHAPDEAAAR